MSPGLYTTSSGNLGAQGCTPHPQGTCEPRAVHHILREPGSPGLYTTSSGNLGAQGCTPHPQGTWEPRVVHHIHREPGSPGLYTTSTGNLGAQGCTPHPQGTCEPRAVHHIHREPGSPGLYTTSTGNLGAQGCTPHPPTHPAHLSLEAHKLGRGQPRSISLWRPTNWAGASPGPSLFGGPQTGQGPAQVHLSLVAHKLGGGSISLWRQPRSISLWWPTNWGGGSPGPSLFGGPQTATSPGPTDLNISRLWGTNGL